MVSAALNSLMWYFFLKYESITELIRRGQLHIAARQLQRIFEFRKTDDCDDLLEFLLLNLDDTQID